jgi:hypothetical protein
VTRLLVGTNGTAVATAPGSLEVADGAHVLLGLCHDDLEQVKKVVRGNAQLALSHVGLHDAQDYSGLDPDKFGQVTAPEVAGGSLKSKAREPQTRAVKPVSLALPHQPKLPSWP